MQAYIDGEKIEWTYLTDDAVWYPANSPFWDWDKYKYRIKQELKYCPFRNAEECWQEMLKHKPFGWIKVNKGYKNIIELSENNKIFINNDYDSYYNLPDTYKNVTFADNTPFGILEK